MIYTWPTVPYTQQHNYTGLGQLLHPSPLSFEPCKIALARERGLRHQLLGGRGRRTADTLRRPRLPRRREPIERVEHLCKVGDRREMTGADVAALMRVHLGSDVHARQP